MQKLIDFKVISKKSSATRIKEHRFVKSKDYYYRITDNNKRGKKNMNLK